MKPIIFIPLPYKEINMDEAGEIVKSIDNVLKIGYCCLLEHDALGEENPCTIVIVEE